MVRLRYAILTVAIALLLIEWSCLRFARFGRSGRLKAASVNGEVFTKVVDRPVQIFDMVAKVLKLEGDGSRPRSINRIVKIVFDGHLDMEHNFELIRNRVVEIC